MGRSAKSTDLVHRDLQRGEVVVFASRMSPARLVPEALVFAVLAGWDLSLPRADAWRVVPGLGLLVVVVVAAHIGLGVATTRYIVTDRRVRFQRGWVRREGRDVYAGQVSGVGSRQGLLGRALGYGLVTIRDTGGRVTSSEFVSRPHDLEGAIQRLSGLGAATLHVVGAARRPGAPGARFCGACGEGFGAGERYCTACGAPRP